MLCFFKSLFTNKKENNPMWLLVGLGNPGKEYAHNRHNVGFMVLDEISGDYKAKYKGQYGDMIFGSAKAGLLKPETYMNESGQSVAAAAKFYKIPADRIVVFHDELDLKPGEVRTKFGGGTAGHNGLKSIKAHLGTPDFWRIRIGIGHPGDKSRVSGYVLSDFSKDEVPEFEDIVYQLAKYADVIANDGMENYESKIKEILEGV